MNLKKLFYKYGEKAFVTLIVIFFTSWLNSLLEPFFHEIDYEPVLSAGKYFISLFTVAIPIYVILLSAIIVFFFYKSLNAILIKFRRLKIIDANYGSGVKFIDITSELNNLVIDNKLKVLLTNGILGYDPTPGVLKTANIKYESNGNILEKKIVEGDLIEIP